MSWHCWFTYASSSSPTITTVPGQGQGLAPALGQGLARGQGLASGQGLAQGLAQGQGLASGQGLGLGVTAGSPLPYGLIATVGAYRVNDTVLACHTPPMLLATGNASVHDTLYYNIPFYSTPSQPILRSLPALTEPTLVTHSLIISPHHTHTLLTGGRVMVAFGSFQEMWSNTLPLAVAVSAGTQGTGLGTGLGQGTGTVGVGAGGVGWPLTPNSGHIFPSLFVGLSPAPRVIRQRWRHPHLLFRPLFHHPLCHLFGQPLERQRSVAHRGLCCVHPHHS